MSGIDIFVDWVNENAERLKAATALLQMSEEELAALVAEFKAFEVRQKTDEVQA